jgi:ribosomal protein S27E
MNRLRHASNSVTPRVIPDMRQMLRVRCLTCQHDTIVSTVSLIERGLGDRSISSFRFRCIVCGLVNCNPSLDKWV